jgi:phage N-6-adenine-methyltransferase|tara:strand:- start:90 stop:620 length:531 start_codon:yes stop_codon:yes gene_type:complete
MPRNPDIENEVIVKTSAFSLPGSALFSRASDEWSTPNDLYTALDDEFCFTLDAAATAENTKSPTFLDRDRDALKERWGLIPSHRSTPPSVWVNPPYSRVRHFMAKAVEEAARGCTVVCLVPSRTDTKWWHESVWDAATHQPRPGVEVRFLRGRVKFGDGKGSAPFPSAVIILRPQP